MKPVVLFLAFALMLSLNACDTTEPSSAKTIAQLVTDDPQFSALSEVLDLAALKQELGKPGPFTVFAPSNQAFATVGTSPTTEEEYKQLLLYHVVAQRLEAKNITGSGTLPTLQSTNLSYTVMGNEVTLTDSRANQVKVTQTDIQATNGVIHVIDAVLLLPDIPAPSQSVR
jgi:uncharacterized surface protein with fasciclin (FAS1) repeats